MLFGQLKHGIQDQFLMDRDEGRVWDDPLVPALTVPYHNTNDFYFSGHLGCITMWTVEYYL